MRPAYYALPSGAWRDYVTLLHLPYSVWHLSYVVIGAAAAPVVHLDRLAALVLAFFLAVGLAAHALDEYRGRPLRTGLSDASLLSIAVASLAGALAIGAVASVVISLWAVPFVVFGCLIVPAYSLEMLGGKFHSDFWFALSWGAFPALVGYWANAERLDAEAFVLAAGCFALSLAQRTLSTRVRSLRRDVQAVTGRITRKDGVVEMIDTSYLLETNELALRLLGLAVALLAAGWLAASV